MPHSLLSLPVGASARIVEVADQPLHTRMLSMGLRDGATLTVIAKGASQSRLVRVGDARLSLAKVLCEAIAVEPISSDSSSVRDVR